MKPGRSRVPAGALQCALLLGWLVSATAAHAELIAAEDFEYDLGAIRDRNGGTGWADAWTGGNLVAGGSLPFAGYEAGGNRLMTLGDSSASGSDSVKCSFRTLAGTGRDHLLVEGKVGKPGTTVWLGFLAKGPNGPNTRRGVFGGISLYDERREQLFLGDCGSTNVWGFERIGELQRFSRVPAEAQTVVFLVYRFTFRTRGTQVEMWVNPKPGAGEPPASDVVAAEVVREFRFNRVRICSAPFRMELDALRIGTTYADVAPAPKRS